VVRVFCGEELLQPATSNQQQETSTQQAATSNQQLL